MDIHRLTRTRRSRCAIAGAFLLLVAAGSVFSLRSTIQWYQPDAPAFRQIGYAFSPVKIVEFSDFECPACRRASKTLKAWLEKYPRQISLTYRHHPMTGVHPWALTAALAAECAGKQGKFWPYHDLLYAHQTAWAGSPRPERYFEAYARQLGLNLRAFNTCRKSPATLAAIQKDQAAGKTLSVQSTPTIFINHQRFVGNNQLTNQGFQTLQRLLHP